MRLAVIGNSHVGMIRAASRDQTYQDHEFLWMAKAGQGSEKFEAEGTRIFTRDAKLRMGLARLGMADSLELGTCDAVVFVGNTLSSFDIATLFRNHMVPDWLSAGDIQAVLEPPNRALDRFHLLSDAALMAHLQDILRNSTTFRLISNLALPSSIPIHVVPQPFPSETLLGPRTKKHPIFRKIAHLNIFCPMANALRLAHDSVFAHRGIALVHHQPADTIVKDLFTRLSFARGSIRLHKNEAHGADDVLHANARYGARMLQSILSDTA